MIKYELAYCQITGAGVEEVNGYYVRDQQAAYPRFQNVANSNVTVMYGAYWTIYEHRTGEDNAWFYTSEHNNESEGPPEGGWTSAFQCPKPDAGLPKLVLLRAAGDFG